MQVFLTPNLSTLSPGAHSGETTQNTGLAKNHFSPTIVVPKKDMTFSGNPDSIPFGSGPTGGAEESGPHGAQPGCCIYSLILGGGEEEAPECSQPAKPSVPETPPLPRALGRQQGATPWGFIQP